MPGPNEAENFPRGNEKTVLLIAPTAGDVAAREAMGLTRCRVVDRIDWRHLGARLGEHGQIDAVLVEAETASDDTLDAALPRIDTFARTTEATVIVALAQRQIDLVASHLLGQRTQLLCDPTIADRVAALALVAPRSASSWLEGNAGGAGEGERLLRLAQEIARIAEALIQSAPARDTIPPRGGVSDAGLAYGAPPRDTLVTPDQVRRAIRARRLRERFFEFGLFEDPAWDMLLDLFAAELERGRVSVSSLCIAAAVAPTTALRWIGKMVEVGLLERKADPSDRRRAFMKLSGQARDAMTQYFAAIARQRLVIL